MRDWIMLDTDFALPSKTFVIPARSLCGERFLGLLRALRDESPEKLAALISSFIAQSRPELAGNTVSVMGWDWAHGSFNIRAIHPSFPHVKAGDLVPLELLDGGMDEQGGSWKERPPLL